jgi:hypothetical protein
MEQWSGRVARLETRRSVGLGEQRARPWCGECAPIAGAANDRRAAAGQATPGRSPSTTGQTSECHSWGTREQVHRLVRNSLSDGYPGRVMLGDCTCLHLARDQCGIAAELPSIAVNRRAAADPSETLARCRSGPRPVGTTWPAPGLSSGTSVIRDFAPDRGAGHWRMSSAGSPDVPSRQCHT